MTAVIPSGTLASTASLASAGSSAAGAASHGALYAVVSKHATWGIFDDANHARLEAEAIRNSGAIQANAVRCSPDMANQYQIGKIGNFVEIDGWAVTSKEVENNALDLLRDARDRQSVRGQLREYHIKQAKRWLDQYETSRSDVFWYSTGPQDGEISAVYTNLDEIQGHPHHFRCSPRLHQALVDCHKSGNPPPAISARTKFHMLESEHDERLENDFIYRLAINGLPKNDAPAELIGPVRATHVAYARQHRWILGAGNDERQALQVATIAGQYFDDEIIVAPASQTLARAVLQQGFEIPGFWQKSRGLLRHELELVLPH